MPMQHVLDELTQLTSQNQQELATVVAQQCPLIPGLVLDSMNAGSHFNNLCQLWLSVKCRIPGALQNAKKHSSVDARKEGKLPC